MFASFAAAAPGASRSDFGRSQSAPGALWDALGRSWDPPGPPRAPQGTLLGPQERPKSPNWSQNCPEIAGVQAWCNFASQSAIHVQKMKSETWKFTGFVKGRPRKYHALGRSTGKLAGALRKKQIDLRNCINFLKVFFEMSHTICPSKPPTIIFFRGRGPWASKK